MVRTLSSTHRRGAKNLPSDVCHPNLYPTAPVLSSLDSSAGSHPTSSRDSSVHADQARFGGTTRSQASCSLACFVAIVTSDVSVAVPALTPASQPSVHEPDPPKTTSSRAAVKANAWLLSSETPSIGVESSACLLAEDCLETLRTRRYASSIEEDFVRLRGLVLTLLSKRAREVFPRRLAPARDPLSSAPEARPERGTSWGPKPEQPDFCRYERTHGQHSYEPSILLRARFATSVRVRQRRPARDFTDSSRCLRPERDQRTGEEPCPLRLSLRSISRPSLSRSSTRRQLPRLRVAVVVNELEECRSVPGTARHATWVAVPKRRLLSAIPAVEVPSFENRGHPVSSLESCS